ncbi:hypothetical protein CYMTET_14164 [Cymbomonas tetramitiformis]|uniref:RNA cytosine-C(5)-methyltransferase NSUN2-like pre-PUA domain-containing protein n=1 Tax=Cymbomonas tetramitiformis TaxID=36881 RepID=A0AAE0GGX4_9CHLO|nr:hypothetical protein CYMTET_14164 [Cymbomonas tetramitiformis]
MSGEERASTPRSQRRDLIAPAEAQDDVAEAVAVEEAAPEEQGAAAPDQPEAPSGRPGPRVDRPFYRPLPDVSAYETEEPPQGMAAETCDESPLPATGASDAGQEPGKASLWEGICAFYGIAEEALPRELLYTRSAYVQTITLVPPAMQRALMVKDQTHRLKALHTGLTVFHRVHALKSPCPFRPSYEGLHLIAPYVTKRLVHVPAVDFCKLCEGGYTDTAQLTEEAALVFRAMDPGGCIVELEHGTGTRKSGPEQRRYQLVAIRGRDKGEANAWVALNTMVGKDELRALKEALQGIGAWVDDHQ